MENSESGDDLGNSFLTGDGSYIVHGDADDDADAALTAENTDDSNHDGGDKLSHPLREQDRFLPIANVAKIMKKAIPETGKIAKDARECVQECVSEFISFITSEASDRCHMEKRKTINGEDILFAMTNLGFDNYVEPLKLYLQKYREATKGDRNMNLGEIYEDMSQDTFYWLKTNYEKREVTEKIAGRMRNEYEGWENILWSCPRLGWKHIDRGTERTRRKRDICISGTNPAISVRMRIGFQS